MRIANTKGLKARWSLGIAFGLALLSLIYGCAKENDINQARMDANNSTAYYEKAVREYNALIKKGVDLDRLYLELGKLYYEHGRFSEAKDLLKKTSSLEAQKLLAISYYHLGDFTDALSIFNKHDIVDDEYLYYYGLTCEKLNLFDLALKIYGKIKNNGEFLRLASQHIDNIEAEGTSPAQKGIKSEIAKILISAPSQGEYPQAGALLLSVDEKIEITNEGTQVSDLHYLIKILNERGKEKYAEMPIGYDSTYEKVELDFARTIKPDGTVMEVGRRDTRDVSRYLDFPLYSNARAYIISFPGVTEGAFLEYRVKIYNSHLINKKDFVLDYPVQGTDPILAARFSLKLPKETILHLKIINENYNNFGANLKPDIREKDGYLTYLWDFKNIPQITPEPSMPPDVCINPTILMSTFNKWEDVYKWWWGLSQDKIKADHAIKEEVKELVKNLASEKEKAQAIYNFCAQSIRYVAIEYGQAGYEPHYAADIFKNKYGDCKDQAILLVTMLREAGIPASPVLISTKDDYNLNDGFPSAMFNHCIVAVSLKGNTIFMDPTAQTCAFEDLPPDDQLRRVLVFEPSEYRIMETPLYPAAHNLIKQGLEIKINKDETIAAERRIFTSGVYDQAQRYWLLYTQPELIQETLNEKIQDISTGAKVVRYNIQNLENLNKPVVLSYYFTGSGYLIPAGPLRLLPQLTTLDTSIVAKDKRRYDIDFGLLDSKETDVDITIPPNFKIRFLPQSFTVDSPWINFRTTYSKAGNKINFKQVIITKKKIVTKAEYAQFRGFYEKLAESVKQRIVLEKT